MRRILVENARRKRNLKQGGAQHRVEIDEADVVMDGPSVDLIALDEALARLAEEDAQLAELVKLRYFAGLGLEQVAQIQGITRRTATSHWAYARAWLHRIIAEGAA
jgi:RNA polymerase sigma factor (TIGR02999 family)